VERSCQRGEEKGKEKKEEGGWDDERGGNEE
jgi:hypothetical protein